jgi:hypothetical protein
VIHLGFYGGSINFGSYGITVNSDGINEFTNKKSTKNDLWERSYFTIREIEVWRVTFKD